MTYIIYVGIFQASTRYVDIFSDKLQICQYFCRQPLDMSTFFETSTRFIEFSFRQDWILCIFQTSTRHVGIFFRKALDMRVFFRQKLHMSAFFLTSTRCVEIFSDLRQICRHFSYKHQICRHFLDKHSIFSKKFTKIFVSALGQMLNAGPPRIFKDSPSNSS